MGGYVVKTKTTFVCGFPFAEFICVVVLYVDLLLLFVCGFIVTVWIYSPYYFLGEAQYLGKSRYLYVAEETECVCTFQKHDSRNNVLNVSK